MRPLSVIVAGGGTGGHLFPGVAIADALLELRPTALVRFVGARGRIEERVVPKLGYPFDALWISGLRRSLSPRNLLFPLKLGVSLWQAWRVLRRHRPDVVVGTGGYASGPLLWLAARGGYPALIHEQNEIPGATTRRLAPLVSEVHVTYESSAHRLPEARRVVVSGNPVRPGLRRRDTAGSRAHFGLDPAKPVLFVFGGSLGAAAVNRAVRDFVPRLVREGVQLLWQTGARDHAALAPLGALYQGQVTVRAFIDEMDAAYSAASLVLCRAGATSLAEITVLGVPAVLVPYPHAAADHQRRNAMAMAAAGAARVVDESEIARLEDEVTALLRNREALREMADAAAALGRPRAAHEIAEAVIRLAARRPDGGG